MDIGFLQHMPRPRSTIQCYWFVFCVCADWLRVSPLCVGGVPAVQWGAVMHDVAKLVGTSSVNTLVCNRCYLPGLKPTFPKDWCTSACLPPRDTSDIVSSLAGWTSTLHHVIYMCTLWHKHGLMHWPGFSCVCGVLCSLHLGLLVLWLLLWICNRTNHTQ